MWGGSTTAVCLHSARLRFFSCFMLAAMLSSLCLLLLFASSLLGWWRDWVVRLLPRGFLRVLAMLVCLHLSTGGAFASMTAFVSAHVESGFIPEHFPR